MSEIGPKQHRSSRFRHTRRAAVTGLALIAFLVLTIWYQYSPPDEKSPLQPADLAARIPSSAILEDIDFLVRTIEEVHVNPYSRTSEADFRGRIEELKAGVIGPLTRRELYRRIAPVVALLEDGHTKVELLIPEINRFIRTGGVWFPFTIRIADSEVTVSENYSSESAIVPGSELSAINGLPIDEIVQHLTRFVSSERSAHRAATLETYFHFYLWLVYEFAGPFEVAFRPPGTEELLIRNIEGITYRALQQAQKNTTARGQRGLFSYTPDPETKSGVLEIIRFADPERFRSFLEKTFAHIRQSGTEHLIIDLRDNGGGSTEVSNELLRYIADQPVRNFARYDLKVSRQIKIHFKSKMPRLVRWLPVEYLFSEGRKVWRTPEGAATVIEPGFIAPRESPLRFDGDVYLLVGPETFSTAADFAALVKDYDLGTLIGEETGGLACSFGDTYPFVLPTSRLDVSVSYKYFVRPSGEKSEGGVIPDRYVIETAEDRASGVDPVLESARELIRQSEHGHG